MAGDMKFRLHPAAYGLDPERMEKKFNEMSAQGWQLVQYGAFDCCYRRGEAGEYEYRALVVKDAGMEKLEYIAALAELGIEEVGSRGEVLFLRKKADGTPFELFSDLDSRIAQQKKARRYLRGGLISSFFFGTSMAMNITVQLSTLGMIGTQGNSYPDGIPLGVAMLMLLTAFVLLAAIAGAIDCTRGLLHTHQTLRRLEGEHLIEE